MWAHDLKLGRARDHLKELEAEIDRWVNIDGYAIRVYPDPKPPAYIIRAEEIREPPDSLALVLGDCLYNARAALEYIAYALGNAGAEGEMTEEQALKSSFPIIGDVDKDEFSGRGPDMFDSTAGHMLVTVTPDARAAIKGLQPFNDGDIWDYNGLWVLNELARLDRHRFLHFGAVRSEGLELDRTRSRNIKVQGRIETFRGTIYPEIEDSADLGRITAYPANPQQKMEMHFTNGLAITLDTQDAGLDSIHGHALDQVVWDTVFGVSEALRALRKFLPTE